MKIEFDKDKLSAREAQILSALVRLAFDVELRETRRGLRPEDGPVPLEALMRVAYEGVRNVMTEQFPDLNFRVEGA